jgi:predicted XRE-type DNA-binding protein
MDHFIAMTSEELRHNLMTAVQKRILAHESQSAAARAWGVPQSVVNEIANNNERCSSQYLMDLLMKDGAAIKMWVV